MGRIGSRNRTKGRFSILTWTGPDGNHKSIQLALTRRIPDCRLEIADCRLKDSKGEGCSLPAPTSVPGSAWDCTVLQAPPALVVAQASSLSRFHRRDAWATGRGEWPKGKPVVVRRGGASQAARSQAGAWKREQRQKGRGAGCQTAICNLQMSISGDLNSTPPISPRGETR